MSVEVRLSRLDLDPAQPLRREPPRRVEQRQADYDLKFDFQTVFYDCFLSVDRRSIMCLGPPLLNLASRVTPAVVGAFGKRTFSRAVIRTLDRVSQFRLHPKRWSAELPPGLFAQHSLAAQPNLCELFRGKRVIMTMSKDNELAWIRDWAEFHARNHGCDAVLIYDNGSTRYEAAKVREIVAAIPGVDAAVVVNWPFSFGPSGAGGVVKVWVALNGLEHQVWDSDFCQYGYLEHARHRILASASAVLNSDIDELVLTAPRKSIFDLARRSRTGYLSFGGIWIENAALHDEGPARRHHQYFYRLAPKPRPATAKWVVVPSRCPARAQWCVHWISGMIPDIEASSHVLLRHFAAITTNWKARRWVPEQPGAAHEMDQELIHWMDIVGHVRGQ